MRILVCSDSHGRAAKLQEIAELHADAEIIVHLGDGAEDCAALLAAGRKVIQVCGNGDFGSQLPGWDLFSAAGKRVLCTHGHLPKVEWGLNTLWLTARERAVQIALFGHTHKPEHFYEDALHLFNPGAVKDGRYGFVDITDAGIFCNHCVLR